MPRPSTKAELVDAATTQYDALMAYLDTLTDAQLVAPGIVGAWSAKDVLAHLSAWSQMCRGWYETGAAGGDPVVPAPGYKFSQTPALNQAIYERHKDDALGVVRARLAADHAALLAIIRCLDAEVLFTPGHYRWTKSTTLGSYFTSATSSHYDWAHKELRKGFRRRG
jgi:hypothetical protein